MAFVNDKFREDEIREYDIPRRGKKKFYVGTIDREKDIRLHMYRNGPVDEPSDLFDFIFDFQGHIIYVCLEQNIEVNTVNWSLKDLDIYSQADIDRSKVIEELRTAIKTYGYKGYKEIYGLGFKDMSVNVLF